MTKNIIINVALKLIASKKIVIKKELNFQL